MPRFLFLLASSRLDRGSFSPAALQGQTIRFADWIATGARAGVIQSGARLMEKSARILRGDGATTVFEQDRADPESYSSYFIVESEDLNSALAFAASCPGADPGTIQVHQLDPSASVGERFEPGLDQVR